MPAPRTLHVQIITLSDRASRGEYEDRGGPRIRELLESHFEGKAWSIDVRGCVLPDDPDQLRQALKAACNAKADVVFTTGGTGVGPRDITPDVVMGMAEKLVPGIMEQIRAKYGKDKPLALLSRGVAAVMGTTVVYTLPGSVKAVEEYVAEILRTMEHLLQVLWGEDPH